jgi:hypothetical protein
MAVANCPSCGAQVEFKIGSSAVVICDYCRTVIARTDRGLEDLGKVAALVDTGSPLRRDLAGRVRGSNFRIVGRTQMRHPMGGTWDEWYAAFDDGTWGWIAEAQGKYYLTVKMPTRELPAYEVLQLGGMLDGMAVTELATATVISGEGEIPFRVEPGAEYDYADLSGEGNRFGTIDYSEEPPVLFEGEETTLAGLGITAALETPKKQRVKVAKLSCSQCGGPLNLVAPDQAERIVCPQCGAMHDIGDGNLQYLRTLENRGPQPRIPLGGHGRIDDQDCVVAGFMQRSVMFDDEKFYWTEYLLFLEKTKSFAWLVDDDGHWSYVIPLPVGEVHDPDLGGAATRIKARGQEYTIFQDTVATVESVVGEFYWRVEVGERARAVDYIAPPMGVTKEFSGTGASEEVNYSLARYMEPAAIETAFGVSNLPRPTKLGTLEPIVKRGCALKGAWMLLVAAFILATIVISIALPHKVLLSESYTLSPQTGADWSSTTTSSTTTSSTTATSTTATTTDTSATDTATTAAAATDTTATSPATNNSSAEATNIIFTKPFTVDSTHNLKVEAETSLANSWLGVDGAVFNEKTGLVEPFQLKLERYSGIDDGESWSEGALKESKEISPLPPGTYSMRIETYWDSTKPAPPLKVTVTEGVFPTSGIVLLILALILLTIPPAIGMLRGRSESERWADSMYNPDGSIKE